MIYLALTLGLIGAGGSVGLKLWDQDGDGQTGAHAALPPTASLLPVPVQAVRSEAHYTITRRFAGRLVAERNSDLGFERGGLLRAVTVDDGDPVTAGATVAMLDTRLLETRRAELAANLAQARAELDEMVEGPRKERIAAARAEVANWQAQLDLAIATHKRQRELEADGHVSVQRLDEARYNEAALRARLQNAERHLEELETGTRAEKIAAQRARVAGIEAALGSVEVDIEKSNLLAPFSGTVALRHLDEGAVVDAGQPVVRILETGAMEARIGIPIDLAGRLRSGSEQTLEVSGQSIPARLTAILPDMDRASRTVTAVLSPTEPVTVPSGMLARLEVADRVPAEGYWLPTAALNEGARGLWTVYHLVPGKAGADVIARRQVELLHSDGARVYVRGTLSAGDRVVMDGVHRLVPGQAVRAVAYDPERTSLAEAAR